MMNEEYFFIDSSAAEDLPSLKANEDTAWRLRRSWKEPEGDAPYVFHNAALDYQMAAGVKPLKVLPDVVIGTDVFFFSKAKFEVFESLGLSGMVAHPCIYMDHKNYWHENLWHVSVVKKIDCWDRSQSEYDEDSAEETKEGIIYTVDRYSLDDEILEKITLNHRLVFRLGGVKYGGTLIHKSLRKFFTDYGVKFIPVKEYSL